MSVKNIQEYFGGEGRLPFFSGGVAWVLPYSDSVLLGRLSGSIHYLIAIYI
jgi:hypothetical protein